MDHKFNFDQAEPRPSLLEDLDESKTALSLIQAAGLLAQSGVRRISATELLEKINLDSSSALTPSQVGIFLHKMGLKKYFLHGRRRFALDSAQLETIRLTLAAQCEERMHKLQDSIDKYQELPDQIQALEDEVKDIPRLEARQRELTQLIAASQPQAAKINDLERQWQGLQQQVKRVNELEQACQELALKIFKLPFLLARKTSLEKGLQDYQNDEKMLTEKEAQLSASFDNLHERFARVDLATLQYNIQLKKQELEELNKQIDDKRSFLDKLLNQHREAGK
jgi:hypothetical protein